MMFDPTLFVPSVTRSRSALRFSARMSTNVQTAEPLTPAQVRQRFGPARTLGAPKEKQLAMDEALEKCGAYDLIQHTWEMGHMLGTGSTGFLGYAFLSNLAQNALIRAGVETVADEMTRKWLEIKGGDSEDDAKVKRLTSDMQHFRLQALFNKAAALVGYFGGCLAYIDTGVVDPETLRAPLHLDSSTFAPGSLKGFRLVEPINVFPGAYNTTDPLREDYFNPQTWWVLGKEYHRSRFLHFTANEVPLLLKPSYNFFGIPVAQLALDYVGHFTETRESAARLLTKFSLVAFKTNLSGILSGGSTADLDARMSWFVQKMSNDGVFVVDKDEEDLVKLDTALGGVVDIPRQAQELVNAIFRVPAVKFWGISPAGFNATGEGDLRNFRDHISSKCEKELAQPADRVIEVLQHNAFGEVNPNIRAEFVKPGDDDPKYVADVNKVLADTDAVYLDRGVLSPEEIRTRIAADPTSGHSGIDVDELPEQPGAGMPPDSQSEEGGQL